MGRDTAARTMDEDSRDRWRMMEDAPLVGAMRASHAGAWAEFHDRFRPVVELYGRRMGISAWLLDEYVDTALDNAALHLTDCPDDVPRNVAGYLCRTLRNHAQQARRGEMRRDRHQRDAADVVYGERVVRSVSSEHALRASEGPLMLLAGGSEERTPASRARDALARALRMRLTEDERRLAAYVQDAVPCREIALWLGVSYGAAAKRISRLKAKLRELAPECIARLDADLQPHVARLLPTMMPSRPAATLEQTARSNP